MAMTPDVWDELIHLREDRQKMLETGMNGKGWVKKKTGCPNRMRSHMTKQFSD